jgi:hypothetical protein
MEVKYGPCSYMLFLTGRYARNYSEPGKDGVFQFLRSAESKGVFDRRINRFDLVLATRVHRATEPRDRFFGLLDITDMGIKADYTTPTEDVYCEFASRWLAAEKPLENLLVYAGCGVHATQTLDLPSWIPDWQQLSACSISQGQMIGFSNINPSNYNAGGHQGS